MDTDALQALVAAIQALAPQAPPGAAAQAPPAMISPYQGAALDLTSRTGTSLFTESQKPFESKFTGKIQDLHSFIAALHTRAEKCRWDATGHAILTIPQGVAPNVTNLHLLDDYGQLTMVSVETVRTARAAANADVRAKQNAQMMYECIINSLSDDARSNLANRSVDTNFHEDGPLLFYTIITDTFQATFSNAQATRGALLNFQPKRLKYNILDINNNIRGCVKTLRAASTLGTRLTDQEIFYFQFKIYKRIKSPVEWTSKILFLENLFSLTPNMNPESLFTETNSHYARLLNEGLWKPSDCSPEEQAIAMAANQKNTQQPGKNQNDPNKNKKDPSSDSTKPPPFTKAKGKLGDKKTWNKKTYYFCPAKHRNTQWHTHPVNDCNVYKKWKDSDNTSSQSTPGSSQPTVNQANTASNPTNNTQVTVDRDTLKQGMAALLPPGDYNIDDFTESLLAAIQE